MGAKSKSKQALSFYGRHINGWNIMQFLIILIPILWFLSAKVIFHKVINFQEVIVSCLLTSLIVLGLASSSKLEKLQDTEIWNGYVTSKSPVRKSCSSGWNDTKDSFCRMYDTRTVVDYIELRPVYNSKGMQTGVTPVTHYKTQYEYDYTWEQNWYVESTLRQYEITRSDRQGAKEPNRWTKVKKGDPVSITEKYDNFVKAVPDSLFNNLDINLEQFNGKIPTYPVVNDYYSIDRVIEVDYSDSTLSDLNYELGKALGRLNPHKQVNANIIITAIQDASFKYAVEYKWVGGKKNDVTIFLGMKPGTQDISWVDVMTFAMNDNNGIFTSTLKSEIYELGSISDTDSLVNLIEAKINKHFDLPEMETYQFLEDEITPSTDALIIAAIINLITCFLLTVVFGKLNFDPLGNIINASRNKPRTFKK